MTRTLIHDAGPTKFYRLISDSICVEQSAFLPEEWVQDPEIRAAFADFCANGLVVGADGRAIGTPFAMDLTPNTFSVSFVPLAGWRDGACATDNWSAVFQRYTDMQGETVTRVSHVGFSPH